MTKTRRFASGMLALAFMASVSAFAQNTNPTNTFDDASSTTSFVQWWGTVTMTWDGTLDAANNPFSGSVKYEAPFVGASGEQFMSFFTIANRWQWDGGFILDASTYTNLSFDLKVDPSSGQRVGNNDFGWLEIGLVTDGWATTALPGRAIPLSATSWTHFDYPLDATLANITKVVGFFIKMWSNGGHTNSLIFNVDNFMITKPTIPVVIPPPTLSLKANTATGLQLIAGASGDYPRQMIRTIATNGNYSWYGRGAQPVTFSMTISEYPEAPYTNFQGHILLVPNPGTENAPDWNQAQTIALMIENHLDGTASGFFRYKTNQPNGNSMMYNSEPTNGPVGHLATIDVPTPIGEWSLSFTHSTNITMSGPGGVSTNITMTEDAMALFASGVQAYFGNQPNGSWKLGQHLTLSRVKVQGTAAVNVDDTFPGPNINQDTNAPVWEKIASDPATVFVLTADDVYRLSWLLPDVRVDTIQVSTNLTDWADTTLWSKALRTGSGRLVVLNKTDLPSLDTSYFRQIKRLPSKLQVLLPGETAAPGTPTGKTGTPTAQTLGAQFTVTVNIVDDDWNIVPSVSHTVELSCSDNAASFLPANQGLSNGTTSFTTDFLIPGNFVFTATDLTDANIAPGVSASVTCN